jgi:two-component system, cell cycle response regulator
VILLYVDHFKTVNDTYGHPAGDKVLRELARRLTGVCRPGDLVARYGGEEFVVILDNATREDAAKIAEEVRTEFAKHTVDTGTGTDLASTVSAGCSALEAWEVEGSVLLERADVALAMAKAAGRDKVVTA